VGAAVQVVGAAGSIDAAAYAERVGRFDADGTAFATFTNGESFLHVQLGLTLNGEIVG